MLRKYSLDELPQLWTVFLGHLSLVGPRPHPLDDYSRYALEHRRRLEVKPGITGLWQVQARRDPSFEKNVALDMEYIQRWSLWLDFWILWKTVAVVAAGTGQVTPGRTGTDGEVQRRLRPPAGLAVFIQRDLQRSG